MRILSDAGPFAIATLVLLTLWFVWPRKSGQKPAIRHAEKTRKHSTCDFADQIARAVLDVYRLKFGPANAQTVVAGVVKVHDGSLSVVSIGVGTKYRGNGLRDMHAEVLARRGFIRYLRAIGNAEGTWHFYTSSAPCGNACIRRWAKCSQGLCWTGALWPPSSHPVFHVMAKQQGEVAFMPKGSDTSSLALPSKFHEQLAQNGIDKDLGPWCCSDKMALWNVLGLQGGQEVPQSREPIFMSTLTCGRKFSEPHMRRAVCCRMAKCPYPVNHPSLLVTSIKLDESVYVGDDSADFVSPVFWWARDAGSEWIDGNTGLVMGGGKSLLQTDRAAPSSEYRAKRREVLTWVARNNLIRVPCEV